MKSLKDDYSVYGLLGENALEKSASILLWNRNACGPMKETRSIDSCCKVEELEALLGAHGGECFSILNVSKTAFDFSHRWSNRQFLEEIRDLKEITINDIYHRYLAKYDDGDVHFNLITPCTITHIKKYLSVSFRFIRESPQMFKSIVEPYIAKVPRERTAWIGKVLSGESEADVMLFHDKDPKQGFIITPDSKWDGVTAKSLYLLVLVMDGLSIRCLRDLRGHHLDMLQRIREKVLTLVPLKYPFINRDQLRLYIHYYPSYFHFHIHVVHADYQGLKGMVVGQSHLLEDVMENLTFDPLYYTSRHLNLFMAESHDLYNLLSNN